MIFPFKDYKQCRITCIYGVKGNHWASGKHDGVDIVCDGPDKTVLAASNGKVIRSGINKSWGQYVVIEIADGRAVICAHMADGSRKVKAGDVVKAGQPIGVMGNTGNSTGAHLHIEIQKRYYKSGAVDDITQLLCIQNVKGPVKHAA